MREPASSRCKPRSGLLPADLFSNRLRDTRRALERRRSAIRVLLRVRGGSVELQAPRLAEWLELPPMAFSHTRDALFAIRKKMHFDLPPIRLALTPLDKTRHLAARHQRHDTVMDRL
jgi:hypothetical protein